jgi:hypothetical protein
VVPSSHRGGCGGRAVSFFYERFEAVVHFLGSCPNVFEFLHLGEYLDHHHAHTPVRKESHCVPQFLSYRRLLEVAGKEYLKHATICDRPWQPEVQH